MAQQVQKAILSKNIALSCDSSLAVNHPTTSDVDRISEPISYEDFFRNYLLQNKPCIMGSFITHDWQSRTDWVQDDGKPNLSFLQDQFGDVTVPIANCEKVQYDAQPKEDMLLKDYIEYWKEHIKQDYLSEMGCLYMKDMHFTRDCTFYKAYETPVYFTSDWLNEFWDSRTTCNPDDYRFVYMGPSGSWTPFHADVFRSFSWSANVCGQKRWILVPPGQEEYLRDTLGYLPYDVTSCDFSDISKYPKFQEKFYTPIEVVQAAGEIIFVPSGWHHQVYNVDDTISINHNWFNGTSISKAWEFLKAELAKVKISIADCREMDGWEQQCQLILRANSGMDYQDFLQLLVIVSNHRLKVIKDFGKGYQILSESKEDRAQSVQYSGKEKLKCSLVSHDSSQNVNLCLDFETDIRESAVNNTIPCSILRNTSLNTDPCVASGNEANKVTLSEFLSCDQSHDAYTDACLGVVKFDHGIRSHDQSGCKSTVPESRLEPQCTKDVNANVQHWSRSHSFWHAVYDLKQVSKVLETLIKNPDSQDLQLCSENKQPRCLYEEILVYLKDILPLSAELHMKGIT